MRSANEFREQLLIERYGEILTLAEVAQVMRYPSAAALRKARARHRLPFELFKLPNRRGWFVTARTLASALSKMDDSLGDTGTRPIQEEASMT